MKSRILANVRFIPRSKTLAEWESENPILLAGEHGVVIDGTNIKREKIGDGVTAWNDLEWWEGASAYEVAVANGFEGTEKEWLESLKGETGADGKDAVTDQTYNSESENAQSGKAVAEALNGYVTKANGNTMTDQAYIVAVNGNTKTIEIEDNAIFQNSKGCFNHCIPRRNGNENLLTRTPTTDLECANKAYVDGLVGDIETSLSNIATLLGDV